MDHTFPYIASITREQFMFYEMRTTARLIAAGKDEKEVIQEITDNNLFQYPTEKMVRGMARGCVKRLKCMQDESLIAALANQPASVSKQICLYAMMEQSRIVWEFMVTVIGEKYRQQDMSFGKGDLNTFFLKLQEQNDTVASWSESTISRIKQVLKKILVDTEYLDSPQATKLNPVWLQPILENAIREKGDLAVLPAFNCLS